MAPSTDQTLSEKHDAQTMADIFRNPSLLNIPSVQTRKALLLLDFLNDFVRPNGRVPVENTQEFLDQIPVLVQSFRRIGDVIWVRTQYEGPRPLVDSDTGGERVILDAGPLDEKTSKKNKKSRAGNQSDDNDGQATDPEAFLSGPEPACLPQSTGAQFPAPILAAIDQNRDIVLTKSDYSALQSPGLVLTLRSRLVTEVYLCGSLSNVSVYATALDAARQGFTITLVEDCLGYRSFARHEEAIRRLADVIGVNGISMQELLDEHEWQEAPEMADRETGAIGLERPSGASQRSESSAGLEGSMGDLAVHGSSPISRISVEPQTMPNTGETDQTIGGDREPCLEAPKAIEVDSEVNTEDEPPRMRFRSARELRRMHPSKPPQAGSPPISRRPGSSAAESGTDRPSYSPVQSTRGSIRSSPQTTASNQRPPVATKKKKKKTDADVLGPDDTIGEGDSRIIYDIELPTDAFHRIRKEVQWQKMYHMSGQVPRLVAVQGEILPDGSIPIYRHPADESPPLGAFTPTVNCIRRTVEQLLDQKLNHVLIQLYRDGQDRISEHSDKTLDIVRGTSIVNVSLGAQRTMVLRTKQAASWANTGDEPPDSDAARQTQRVPMPDGSMFVLGPLTNMRWLHGIRPDKRPDSEKTPEELAYNGERISLTFRSIGTFINLELQSIWGQGAVSKTGPEAARKIIHGDSVEVERLIQAFGRENRESEFDWDEVYGSGFDVVNFVTPSVGRLFLSGDAVADLRVVIALTENGLRYEAIPPSRATQNAQPIRYTSPDGKTTVSGDIEILLYLGRLDPEPTSVQAGVNLLRGGAQIGAVNELLEAWRQSTRSSAPDLTFWEQRMREAELQHGHHYISGPVFDLDDCALWPVLREMQCQGTPVLTPSEYPYLLNYYQRIEKRGSVRNVLADFGLRK